MLPRARTGQNMLDALASSVAEALKSFSEKVGFEMGVGIW